jgi:hypothetical protein
MLLEVEASRPDFDAGETARWIKTPEPGWVVGKGLNGSVRVRLRPLSNVHVQRPALGYPIS